VRVVVAAAACFGACGLAPAQGAAQGIAAEPRIATRVEPLQARFEWRIDGVTADAREYRVREPIEPAVARLQADWRAEFPREPVSVTQFGAARLLGQRANRAFRVAQFTVEPDGTTRVVESTRALEMDRPTRAPDVPIASGSRVIRRVEMGGTPPVVQVYALATEPPPLAEARFDAAARRAGWDPLPASHRRFATAVQAWRRDGDELLVVTTPIDSGTGVLLHLTPRTAGEP
jgi:hypothetical protein